MEPFKTYIAARDTGFGTRALLVFAPSEKDAEMMVFRKTGEIDGWKVAEMPKPERSLVVDIGLDDELGRSEFLDAFGV